MASIFPRQETPSSYTRPAILLHWLMAALILGSFSVGLYMHDLPLSPHKLKVYSWHKWAGVTIFFMALARLAWRLGHPSPVLPAAMPGWQKVAATGLHHVFYVLMLAIPLSGWLMSSAKGFQTVWFGVLPLPDLVNKDEELGALLQTVHETLNFFLAGSILLHAAAALKHHFVDRDDVLVRMLPFLGRSR